MYFVKLMYFFFDAYLRLRFSFSYLAYSIQSVAGLWISNSWNHELKDVECKTNISQTEFELIKTQCYIVSIFFS